MLSYDFDWSILWREPYGQWLLKGLIATVIIGLSGWVIALAVGILIGTLRVTSWRLTRWFGTAYVEIFRNIPLLVQIFFWFYAGPQLFPESLSRTINRLPHLNYYVAIVGLGLYTASRVAEHLRAGFASIHRDQYQASLATGLSRYQMYRHVIVPYALRLIIPPLTTEFLAIFKNTSIVMTIGVAELTFMSYKIDAETFHGMEATTGAMLIYLAVGLLVIKVMGKVEKAYKIHGMLGR